MPASLVQQGVSESMFYNNLSGYRSAIDSDPGRPPFNTAGFVQEIQDSIITPANKSLAAHGRTRTSRASSTMSAEEMTIDPDFDFNSDAPDVSNVYTAKATFETCDSDWSKRRVKLELPDGRFWYVSLDGPLSNGPSSLRIEQWADVGPPRSSRTTASWWMTRWVTTGAAWAAACSSTEAGSAALLSLIFALWASRRRAWPRRRCFSGRALSSM